MSRGPWDMGWKSRRGNEWGLDDRALCYSLWGEEGNEEMRYEVARREMVMRKRITVATVTMETGSTRP